MPRPSMVAIEEFLIVTLQDDPTFSETEGLLSLVGEAVVANTASGLLIDVSILSLIDSYVAQTLSSVVAMARWLGCKAIIAGMRPEVALTMVELGIELPEIGAALNVNIGLATLRQQIGLRT